MDVKDLVLVLNFDVPNHHEDYVHRVGRTGRAGNKGTAITFIGPEEDRYAPDLVKAMRDSGCEAPQDLIALATGFTEKRRQGLVNAHGSGYGGSGFKFNSSEQDQYVQARKAQAKELAGTGAAEEEHQEEEHVFDEDGFAVAKVKPETATSSQVPPTTKSMDPPASASQPYVNPQVASLLSNAAQIVAARIAPTGQQLPMAPPPHIIQNSAMSSAMLAAAASIPGVVLHTGAQRAAALAGSMMTMGTINGRYFAELEINDFPQLARWKVTHRDTVQQVAELTGCAVIVKGVFVPPGKPVPTAERRIYLSIEGPSDTAVKKAKLELKKVIEEQTEKAMRKEGGAGGGAVLGRYTVI